jgi:hypothetical protein
VLLWPQCDHHPLLVLLVYPPPPQTPHFCPLLIQLRKRSSRLGIILGGCYPHLWVVGLPCCQPSEEGSSIACHKLSRQLDHVEVQPRQALRHMHL